MEDGQLAGAALLPLLDPDLPEELARAILQQAGVSQSHRAAEQLQALTSKPWGPLGRVRVAESFAFALALLMELFASPDPDAALRHVTALTLRLGPLDGLWSLLEHSRPTLRLLCSLLGSSDYLARLLIRSPELLDSLLLGRRANQRADPRSPGRRARAPAGAGPRRGPGGAAPCHAPLQGGGGAAHRHPGHRR